MPRKTVIRTLPAIAETFVTFKGFPPEQSKQRVLLQELRRAAKKLQQKSSRPFYSMRQVVKHFSVHLRTVAIIYEELELEGVLNRIRGSKTMLVGKKKSPRISLRGVVGLPIWLHSLVVSPYERALQIEFEERLRKTGFVADFIFFRTGEDCSPDFAKRLLRHNLDVVIWQAPHPLSSHVILSLRDRGIRQILIHSTEMQLNVPARTYLQNSQPAYREMAKAWITEKISRVIIPEPPRLPSQRTLRIFSGIMNSHNIAVDVLNGQADALLKKVRERSQNERCAVTFLDIQGADSICNGRPQVMEEISKDAKIAFCRGPIRIPYFSQQQMKADIVEFNPAEIAQRVVEDIASSSLIPEGLRHTFLANYQREVSFDIQSEQL